MTKPAVLVVPSPAPESAAQLLSCTSHFFMEREKAENELSVKQVIPYIVVTKNGSVLAYRRSGGTTETRLQGMLSIGWGGHIEEVDAEHSTESTDLPTFIRNCAMREIQEELSLGEPLSRVSLGLINDDESEVGRYHIGLLESWEYSGDDAVAAEDTAEEVFWVPFAGLEALRAEMESWSSIAAQQIVRRSGALSSGDASLGVGRPGVSPNLDSFDIDNYNAPARRS